MRAVGKKNPAATELLTLLDDPLVIEATEAYIQSNPDLQRGPFLDQNERQLLARISEGSSRGSVFEALLEEKLTGIASILEVRAEEAPEAVEQRWSEIQSKFSEALNGYLVHRGSGMLSL
jgi:uncharacterized protein YicC (UPF0701 family)